jgi:hypothetical protein
MDRSGFRASEVSATAREILSLLTEDLYSPWEIAVQVPADRNELQRTIDQLLANGLAEWFRREDDRALAVAWPEQLPTPNLGADDTWAAADLTEPQILLGITDEGAEVYYRA